ncbi:MAG: hypothetical protein HYX66_07820 [Ignavibacteria bacterium]|nr:hypothetical protein [Ignavibacteria bacterium]
MRYLLIIPAIDLANGHCARKIDGEEGTQRLYSELSDHPIELAQLWRRENAKCIHITDTDSFAGNDYSQSLDVAIRVQQAVDIPIELVTLQRDVNVVRELLNAGIYRVAINALVQSNPDGVRKLIEDYGSSRVIFGVRAHAGIVEMDGGEAMTDIEMIRLIHELGGIRVIYTEKDWEGALTGEDLETINRIAEAAPIRITMAGGIASPQDLWDLQEYAPRNIDSVVIGRALYENRFPCQRIWRAVEAKLEPDIHAHSPETTLQSTISPL